MTDHNKGTEEQVNIIRYTAVPSDEVGFRIDPSGEWVRFEDVWQELVQLRKRVRQLAQDIREMDRETLDIASEAMWKERQGDEYGSY